MKRIAACFLILLAAVAIGLVMHLDNGYVLLAYNGYTIETTLWFLLIAIALLFLVIVFLAWLFTGMTALSGSIDKWAKQRKIKKAHKATNLGFCNWLLGEWRLAEKKLLNATKNSSMPLLNYLIAADAAQNQKKHELRDEYIHKAYRLSEKFVIAVRLQHAQLLLEAGQLDQALVILKLVRQKLPHNKKALKALYAIYSLLENWEAMKELLPSLHKNKVFSPDELQDFAIKIYGRILTDAAKANSVARLKEAWEQVPTALKNAREMMQTYCEALLKFADYVAAEKILLKTINKNWDEKLVAIYANLPSANPSGQLKIAESWLKKHAEDPVLLLCLGRLCKKQRLWGKAQRYLELSSKLDASAVVYNELGEVMDSLGNSSMALHYYRKSRQC